ncbi:MAG: phospholipase/carboxylesterase [Alphaproteobacteria bacterium]|jgi:phospholipase/carboxylesterase
MLSGPEYIPDGAKKAVVLLHGFGSDGEDLFSLAPYMAREGLEQVAFFAPNGPSMTDSGEGYQWFGDKGWTFIDRDGIEEARDVLETYITRHVCASNGIAFSDVAIVSFSQGTMTSLFAAPRFQEKIAGVVALSGRMMWHEELEDEDEYHTMPVHLIHGETDEVVESNESYISYSELEGLGFEDISIKVFEGLGHAIDKRVIKLTAKHLRDILKE